MQRRQLLSRLGGLALAAVPVRLFGNRMPLAEQDCPPGLWALVEEADDAYYESNLGKAHELYLQSLKRLPEVESIAIRAHIIETYYDVEKEWKEQEESLVASRAEVASNPQDANVRYVLASGLKMSGRNEEAIAEFHRTLDLLASKDTPRSNRDRMHCIIGIGVCHYRQGRYEEALNWLEKVQPWKVDGIECVNSPDSCIEDFGYGQFSIYWEALHHRLLTYAKLKRIQEARAGVLEHVRYHGRLQEPISRALAEIGIDSDGIYVEHAAPKIV